MTRHIYETPGYIKVVKIMDGRKRFSLEQLLITIRLEAGIASISLRRRAYANSEIKEMRDIAVFLA